MTRNLGRFAGIVYLLVSLPVMFALLYAPGKIIVRADPAATAANIVAAGWPKSENPNQCD